MPVTSLNQGLFSAVSEKKEKIILNRLFGKHLTSSNFQVENSVARCGCYLCQARNLNGETDTPGPTWVHPVANTSNILFRGASGILQYFAGLNQQATLDSLGAVNSPYIDGLMWGAKWGDLDPDSNLTTELQFYYYKQDESSYINEFFEEGGLSYEWEDLQKTSIRQAMKDYEDVANITFAETLVKDDAHIRCGPLMMEKLVH